MRLRFAPVIGAVGIVAASLVLTSGPASAYGHVGTLNMWQVGLSFNCNNPSACAGQTGGFWGWAQFTQDPANGDTDADAELTGCGHTVAGGGPGLAGAGHFEVDAPGWIVKPSPDTGGLATFWLTTGEQTFTGHGQPVTVPLTDNNGNLVTPDNPFDTGIPAAAGHYSLAKLFGVSIPGVNFQIQVAYKPAR